MVLVTLPGVFSAGSRDSVFWYLRSGSITVCIIDQLPKAWQMEYGYNDAKRIGWTHLCVVRCAPVCYNFFIFHQNNELSQL